MATEAQIEANRRNSKRSTGPCTQEGKNRSKLNALVHGCRAKILVLPTEDCGEYEEQANAWNLSWQPRNPVEEFLVDRVVNLSWQAKRIDRAQTARLSTRILRGDVDAADGVQANVIELGQRLFRDTCGPRALQLKLPHNITESSADGDTPRNSDDSVDEDHPSRLVQRLQETGAGCQWLLDQWAALRALLERGVAWLAPDKLKAVCLLGRHPMDALDSIEVARLYLASHVVQNQGGDPFQEIINELSAEEATVYVSYLQQRHFDTLAPKDAAAARQFLLDLVDRTTEQLGHKAEAFRERAELSAVYAFDLLSWDDTAEGEHLRRYEMTCKRSLHRMFDLLLKIRRTGNELQIAAIGSLDRSVRSGNMGVTERSAPAVATVVNPPPTPVTRPDPPIEANPDRGKAPNEAKSPVQTPSPKPRDGLKDFRIDLPHLDRNTGGIGITGNEKMHPALHRLLTGQQPMLLDQSAIFGK